MDVNSSFILVLIAVPSILLLYFVDISLPVYVHTVKVIGGQWFWVYEDRYFSSDGFKYRHFDSYTVNLESRSWELVGFLRLLDVDNQLVLRVGQTYRLLVTSTDVLHSWAVQL